MWIDSPRQYPSDQGFGFVGLQQYNTVAMERIIVGVTMTIVVGWSSLSLAAENEPLKQPSAQERLTQVLDGEGGTTVYMDAVGNVHNTIDLPNGDRIVTVQPPQSQGFNLGPPLQLNNRTLQLPPPPPVPAQPPSPEYPQRAR